MFTNTQALIEFVYTSDKTVLNIKFKYASLSWIKLQISLGLNTVENISDNVSNEVVN